MGYKNATSILPCELLRAVQTFVDGEYLYIPRRDAARKAWGDETGTRRTLQARNQKIAAERRAGCTVAELADRYFLSEKTIHKIVRRMCD